MAPSADDDQASRRTPRPGTIRLGTVAGIQITVAHSWFLIVGLIAVLIAPRLQLVEPRLGALAYLAGIGFAVLLYLSVLLHEISHALAARAFQMPVNSINLHFLGGATEIDGEATTPWREFAIAVVGPLTSLAIGGLAFWSLGAFGPQGLPRFAVAALAGANLVVGALNLVPGLPLDGGRVLQAVVWGLTKKRALGITIASWGGRVAAVAALGYPFVLPMFGARAEIIDYLIAFMIASFLWTGATQSLAMAKVRDKLPSLSARRLARPAIGVPADLPLAEAIRRAQEAHAGSVVVITGDGKPAGIVNEDAVASTPQERRPWMASGDLARRIESGLLLSADLVGEQLLRAMNHTPATEYVLLEPNGSIYGVLVTKDVDNAFRFA
ncbi:MAG: site-2 protease family protein [Nocardioidaceae bacterium]